MKVSMGPTDKWLVYNNLFIVIYLVKESDRSLERRLRGDQGDRRDRPRDKDRDLKHAYL